MASKKHTATQKTYTGPVYLDCNATTPLEPEVFETLRHYLLEDFGNEGSRKHEFGSPAKQAVQKARDQVAALARARREEVIFTSGATESNNLAILGFGEEGPDSEPVEYRELCPRANPWPTIQLDDFSPATVHVTSNTFLKSVLDGCASRIRSNNRHRPFHAS